MYTCVIETDGKITNERKMNHDALTNAINLYKTTGYSKEFRDYARKLPEQSLYRVCSIMNENDRYNIIREIFLRY